MHFTIKVPFRLLDLTLMSPIVETPTQYFPCKPSNSTRDSGFWQFGRAFLQAAFVGANYEQLTAFLAQAPGPYGEGSIIKEIMPEASTIESSSIDWFRKSWEPLWTVLEESQQGNGLSPGVIGGITAGSVVAVLLVITVTLLWRRHMRRVTAIRSPPSESRESGAAPSLKSSELSAQEILPELGDPLPHQLPDFHGRPAELGDALRHELC